MKLTFLPPAKTEVREASRYYNKARKGLGAEFRHEIELALQRIVRLPTSGQALSRNSRRHLVDRFPYGIVYQIRDDEILIVAVMHLHRDPNYWQDRLPSDG